MDPVQNDLETERDLSNAIGQINLNSNTKNASSISLQDGSVMRTPKSSKKTKMANAERLKEKENESPSSALEPNEYVDDRLRASGTRTNNRPTDANPSTPVSSSSGASDSSKLKSIKKQSSKCIPNEQRFSFASPPVTSRVRFTSTPIRSASPATSFADTTVSEDEKHMIIYGARKAVQTVDKIGDEWYALRVRATSYLEEFVAHKLDAHGNVTQALDLRVVRKVVQVGDILKTMGAKVQRVRDNVQMIKNLQDSSELFAIIVPFTNSSLRDIFAVLKEVLIGYETDYDCRLHACNDLMASCSFGQTSEQCTNILNNIMTVWTSEVHVQRADPRIGALLLEMGE